MIDTSILNNLNISISKFTLFQSFLLLTPPGVLGPSFNVFSNTTYNVTFIPYDLILTCSAHLNCLSAIFSSVGLTPKLLRMNTLHNIPYSILQSDSCWWYRSIGFKNILRSSVSFPKEMNHCRIENIKILDCVFEWNFMIFLA